MKAIANNGKNRVLVVTSVASMIDQFILPGIRVLLDMGCLVDVAANFKKGNTCTEEKITELCGVLKALGVRWFQIDFIRDARHLPEARKAYCQLDRIMNRVGGYAFLHCHSPIGGVIGRILARKHSVPVIYTAHGFHFYKGASCLNWLVYYPIERILSTWTDALITINKEDYLRAKNRLKMKKLFYIAGIGIDFERFRTTDQQGVRERKRRELGLTDQDTALFSVGELNKNKNHKTVILALAKLSQTAPQLRAHMHYFVAGKGSLEKELTELASQHDVKLHLLGFRWDIAEILKAVDCFLLPSYREGMNVSLLEAAVSGVPCLSSDIRGSRDILPQENLIPVTDVEKWSAAIMRLEQEEGYPYEVDEELLKKYDVKQVSRRLRTVYSWMQDQAGTGGGFGIGIKQGER